VFTAVSARSWYAPKACAELKRRATPLLRRDFVNVLRLSMRAYFEGGP
jgi:hypothetical protein